MVSPTTAAVLGTIGVVSVDAIIGEAVFTNWPLDEVGPVPDPEYE